MKIVTIMHIKRNDHYVTWFCGECGYFRDSDKAGLSKLNENVSLSTIEKRVKCQRYNHFGGTQISHEPSINPFPGKVFWSTTPWKQSKLIEFEPDTDSYKQQEAFLRHTNS